MSDPTKKGLVPVLRFPEFRDSGEWERDKLANLIVPVTPPQKLPTALYQTEGQFPIIDQSQSYICGWTNDQDVLINDDLPLIIFGDHTCAIKIVDVPFAQGADGIKILKNKKQTETGYLYQYLLFNPVVMEEYKRHFSILKEKLIFFPKKESGEQQKIADCLSSIDELVTAQTQKVEALKAHKKGLMQQLFPAEGETVPKLRFPEFRDAGEWEEIKLIETADKKIKWSFIGGPFGSNLKSSDYTANGVRIIQLQNIGDAEFINNYKIFTSEEKADELLSCNIYPGDIILSKMGDPVGRACLIPNNHNRYIMCSDGIRLAVDEKLHCKYFIYSLINSIQFRTLVEKTATGSTRKRIGLDDLKNLPMIVPKTKEQQKIADCLSSIDDLITAQTQKLAALKAHKKGLMQQLFPAVDDDCMDAGGRAPLDAEAEVAE